MKTVSSFILVIFFNFCFGQDADRIDNKICVKINPLNFIDPYGGYSYRLGAEFKIHDNVAGSIAYGRYFSYGNKKIDLKINAFGYILLPEIKIYLNKTKLTTGRFLSLEFLHKKITYDYEDSIKIGANPVYQKQYTISKNISCLTVKYGDLKVYEKRFLFEWYVGIGVRFSNGYNTLTEQESNGILTGENHGDLISDGQRAINYVSPNLILGLKLGYSFK